LDAKSHHFRFAFASPGRSLIDAKAQTAFMRRNAHFVSKKIDKHDILC